MCTSRCPHFPWRSSCASLAEQVFDDSPRSAFPNGRRLTAGTSSSGRTGANCKCRRRQTTIQESLSGPVEDNVGLSLGGAPIARCMSPESGFFIGVDVKHNHIITGDLHSSAQATVLFLPQRTTSYTPLCPPSPFRMRTVCLHCKSRSLPEKSSNRYGVR